MILGGRHIVIYIALSEINLDAPRRTTAAFRYDRPIICSHVLNYFVDHLNLSEDRSEVNIVKEPVKQMKLAKMKIWEKCVVRAKVKLTSSGQ
jgi:hypothetical protein